MAFFFHQINYFFSQNMQGTRRKRHEWVSSSDAKNWFETSSDADNDSWLKWEFTTPVIVTRIEWGKRYSTPWLGHDCLSNLLGYHRISL